MKREGLVRLTDNTDLFYDSISKEYKYRMHCPACHKVSGIFCFEEYDSIPMFQEEYPSFYCSDRCFVLDANYEIKDIAEALGITIKFTIEEWNASKIVRALLENFDGDYDMPSGHSCGKGE